MGCCSVPAADTGRFFSRLARLHRIRFKLFGFETSQRHLLEGIKQQGHTGARLLEIGCGPGYLHQALLKSGAARATGIDLSERMMVEARALARSEGLAEVTDYRQGDFVELAGELNDADVTVLDKVLCCYPDVASLVDRSLDKTRKVYGLTYPRDRALTRAGMGLMACLLRLLGSSFRPYVHDPSFIEARIVQHGFEKTYTNQTLAWLTQVYTRIPA
jgi:magnesium-protoporphyrin O-methyltransferase